MRTFDGSIVSNPGSPRHPIRKMVVGLDGVSRLQIVGYEDTDELIQSHLESTDLSMLVKRYANGDLSVLDRLYGNANAGIYGDFSVAPTDLRSSIEFGARASQLFYDLPLSVREKFDNSVEKFTSQAGSDGWFDSVREVLPAEVSEKLFSTVSRADSPVSRGDVNE